LFNSRLTLLIAAIWLITVSSLGAATLADAYSGATTFFVYLIPQIVFLALAMGLSTNKDTYFVVGVVCGTAFTTVMSALFELVWLKSGNSLPFLIHLFIVCPSLALGIGLSRFAVYKNFVQTPITTFCLCFAFTTPVAWYLLVSHLRG
jgi:hypothetical protein